jgi:hypothetical protein
VGITQLGSDGHPATGQWCGTPRAVNEISNCYCVPPLQQLFQVTALRTADWAISSRHSSRRQQLKFRNQNACTVRLVIICVLSQFNHNLKIDIHYRKYKKGLICNLSVKHASMSAKLYLIKYKEIKILITVYGNYCSTTVVTVRSV